MTTAPSKNVMEPSLRSASGHTRWQRFAHWARKTNLSTKLEIALALLALLSGIATFAALSQKSGPVDIATGTVRGLLLLNFFFLLAIAALVARRLVRIWVARKAGSAGSKLHRKIVGFFSIIAVGPPILMAVFSAIFLEYGIQSWFSERVRDTLNESLSVAEAYIQEHRRVIEADISAMASDLNRQAAIVEQDRRLLRVLVDDQAAKRALSEAIVFTSTGNILARATMNLDLAPDRVPENLLQRAQEGELVIISETDDDRVRALVRLDGFFDAFLYVSRFVDARVLGHVDSTRAAIAEYESLERGRTGIQLQFNLVFLVVSLLILMAAVWLGLWLATQMVTPISRLVEASERVSEGDLNVSVPASPRGDEIGTLSRAFNRMIRQIKGQQKALMTANEQLDERRRFTEAVLSGVSAGVMGLDIDGMVTLPNRSALTILGLDESQVINTSIEKVIPGTGAMMKRLEGEGASIQQHVNITLRGMMRTLLVRLSTETSEGKVTGYVVTFDDITEQLADQRTAAWADVARRIAHEIKNPLTPIQLSAERIRRKYAKEISSDPKVFDQCTDTIIRQVGDLRRMVDEFSSFARMPKPVFREEDILDLVRQTLFLQQVGYPEIFFELDAGSDPVRVKCDGRLIAQALTNLTKNAVESISSRPDEKNTEKGHIKITVQESKNTVNIIIDDNGCGISEEMADRLFEPYVTSRSKGTGLGLAIVRKIMEDHGGNLTIANRKEGGARAVLTFNRLAQQSPDKPEKSQKAPRTVKADKHKKRKAGKA